MRTMHFPKRDRIVLVEIISIQFQVNDGAHGKQSLCTRWV